MAVLLVSRWSRLAFAALTLMVCTRAFAQAPIAPTFQVPALTGPVVDEARMLSPDVRGQLERYLRRLRDGGGSQIQVVTLDTLGGLSIEEVGIKLADAWKLGDAKKDDGIILIVARAERRVRIEVGQGREGDLPDITASRIIREVIVPRLRQGSGDQAIVHGVAAIVHYTDPNVDTNAPATRESGGGSLLIQLLLLFGLLIFGVFMSQFNRRGPWGGFGGGGFGGGGFGGGGFGGFGGGDSGGGWSGGGGGFSGGGSSGSW